MHPPGEHFYLDVLDTVTLVRPPEIRHAAAKVVAHDGISLQRKLLHACKESVHVLEGVFFGRIRRHVATTGSPGLLSSSTSLLSLLSSSSSLVEHFILLGSLERTTTVFRGDALRLHKEQVGTLNAVEENSLYVVFVHFLFIFCLIFVRNLLEKCSKNVIRTCLIFVISTKF
jgi:hypothetical protein